MKKNNLTIVATIIATFVISMFAFQLTIIEANNNVSPIATPSPRKIVTKRKTSTGVWEHTNIPPSNKVKPNKSKGFTEVTGLDIQVERRKHSRRTSNQYNPKEIGIDKVKGGKGYTAMPDLDANSNRRKNQTRKSSKSEVSIESIERRKQKRKN